MKALYTLLILFIIFFTSCSEPENKIKQDYITIHKEDFFLNEHSWQFEYDSVIVLGNGQFKKRYFIPPGTEYVTPKSFDRSKFKRELKKLKITTPMVSQEMQRFMIDQIFRNSTVPTVYRIADEKIYFKPNYDWKSVFESKSMIVLMEDDKGTGLDNYIKCNPEDIKCDSIFEVFYIWDVESFSSTLPVNDEYKTNPGSLEEPHSKYVHPKVIEIIENKYYSDDEDYSDDGAKNKNNDLGSLKGKVKEITTINFNTRKIFGLNIKEKNTINSIKYDEDGNKIEEEFLNFYNDGELFEEVKTLYNSGKEIKQIIYSYGKYQGKFIFKHDDDGNVIEKTFYHNDGEYDHKYIFKHDEDGNVIEKAYYKNNNDTLNEKYIFKHDEDGNVIESSRFYFHFYNNHNYEKIKTTDLFKYDKDGNKIEEIINYNFDNKKNYFKKYNTIYDKDRNERKKEIYSTGHLFDINIYEYEYDKEKNWTKKITYSKNILDGDFRIKDEYDNLFITEREIDYY